MTRSSVSSRFHQLKRFSGRIRITHHLMDLRYPNYTSGNFKGVEHLHCLGLTSLNLNDKIQ